jgi:hypothetical protein
MKSHLPVLSALALSATGAASAGDAAEPDWFASVYTEEGIELRADERVFTLYALLNAMGYDEGSVARQHPLPRHQFHPVRAEIRRKLLAADPEVRSQADAFFDAHPRPIARYLAYTVQSSPPPFAIGARSKQLQDLKGLEVLLHSAYSRWQLGELMAQLQGEYRKAMRAYLPVVDRPILEVRKLLRVPDPGPRSLLMLNLLEADNRVSATMGEGEVVVVVGPSPKPNVEGLVSEYARVLVEPAVAQKAQSSWAGGAGLLREAQLAGATETTVGEYATALFARAVALRALDAPQAAYDAAAQTGYFGLRDIAHKLDEQRPVEAWAIDALQRAESRCALRK